MLKNVLFLWSRIWSYDMSFNTQNDFCLLCFLVDAAWMNDKDISDPKVYNTTIIFKYEMYDKQVSFI